MSSPIFSPFHIHEATYKTVLSHRIPLYILLPKDPLPSGPRPIIVHFHGGFLVTGHALFADWTAQWALDYQLRHRAIRVSADYRLLPESSGLDILSDARDVLSWVETSLGACLQSVGSHVTPDLDRILLYGDSAGGYLAIQCALMRRDLVRAVVAAYPMTWLEDRWYNEASTTKSPMGAPQIPRAVFDQHVSAIAEGSVVTSALPPERVPLSVTMLQNGLFSQVLGTDESLYPGKVLEKMGVQEEKRPFLYLLHGIEDTVIPVEHSKRFVELWRAKFGEESAVERYEHGEHAFDGEVSLGTGWMAEDLNRVASLWLGHDESIIQE